MNPYRKATLIRTAKYGLGALVLFTLLAVALCRG